MGDIIEVFIKLRSRCILHGRSHETSVSNCGSSFQAALRVVNDDATARSEAELASKADERSQGLLKKEGRIGRRWYQRKKVRSRDADRGRRERSWPLVENWRGRSWHLGPAKGPRREAGSQVLSGWSTAVQCGAVRRDVENGSRSRASCLLRGVQLAPLKSVSGLARRASAASVNPSIHIGNRKQNVLFAYPSNYVYIHTHTHYTRRERRRNEVRLTGSFPPAEQVRYIDGAFLRRSAFGSPWSLSLPLISFCHADGMVSGISFDR